MAAQMVETVVGENSLVEKTACVCCGAAITGKYQLVYDEDENGPTDYLGTICFECYVCWYQEEDDRLEKVIEFKKKHPNADACY